MNSNKVTVSQKTAIFAAASFFSPDFVFSSDSVKTHCIELHEEYINTKAIIDDLKKSKETLLFRFDVSDSVDASIILKSLDSLIGEKEDEIDDVLSTLKSYVKSEARCNDLRNAFIKLKEENEKLKEENELEEHKKNDYAEELLKERRRTDKLKEIIKEMNLFGH